MKKRLDLQFFPSKEMTPNSTEEAKDWLFLENPYPYKAILARYEKEKRSSIGDEENEYFYKAQNYIVVNGIRVQKYHHSYSSGYVYSSNWYTEDLAFSLERPSLSIFDPLGVCPINLQRSAVSFDRMGKDLDIAKCIILDFIKKIKGLSSNIITSKKYFEIKSAIESSDGISFNSKILPPLCATASGIFFSSIDNFEKLNIKSIYVIFTDELPDISFDSILNDGEAVFIRENIRNDQSKLIWFRGIFSSSRQDWYAGDSGLPLLNHDSEVGFLLNNSWQNAIKKGKVSQQIMKRVDCSSKSTTHKLVCSGNTDDKLIARLDEIFDKVDGISEIYGWNITHQKTRNLKPSLLKKALEELSSNIYLSGT